MIELIRQILPQKAWEKLRTAKNGVSSRITRSLGGSAILTYFAYLTSRSNISDFRSLMIGSRKYFERNIAKETNIARIRRNIHRLEKGLCFPQRRESFANDYILETVQDFELLAKANCETKRSETKWAHDVLGHYFQHPRSNSRDYDIAKDNFYRSVSEYKDASTELPYRYRNSSSAANVDSLFQLLERRKSVREFSSQAVPREALENALRSAALAPSSCNRQPYRYHIVDTPEKAQLAASISAGTAGWVDQVRCLAVLVGDRSNFPNVQNRHNIYIDATLSVMPFVLALEAQGFSTCIINWADDSKKRRKMSGLLGLESYERVVLSIAIGKAKETATVAYSKRKHPSEIVRYY